MTKRSDARRNGGRSLTERAAATRSTGGTDTLDPRPTLVHFGAPLMWRPDRQMTLEAAVARALTMLADDPTLLLSLPVVLAANENELVFEVLRRQANALGVEAELGMMLDLTAQLSGTTGFHEAAKACSKAEGAPRYLDTHTSRLQREAADQRTPAVVARWGFRANTSEASFRQFFEKHHG